MRVVIAEDSPLFRAGLVRLLTDAGCEVVEAVGDGDAAVAAALRHLPDVAVLDIRMPPTRTDEGLTAALRIREQAPQVAILMLSQYLESHWAVQLLGAGAGHTGYLLKDRVGDVDQLVDALRRVSQGGVVVDPEVVAGLVGRQRADDPLATLSERERAVLELMAEGRTNQAIAGRLFLSEKTIETHIRAVFQKLRLPAGADDHRRVLAVLRYLRS